MVMMMMMKLRDLNPKLVSNTSFGHLLVILLFDNVLYKKSEPIHYMTSCLLGKCSMRLVLYTIETMDEIGVIPL
jgi:hypothetical protein